jgi:hypothetical protein
LAEIPLDLNNSFGLTWSVNHWYMAPAMPPLKDNENTTEKANLNPAILFIIVVAAIILVLNVLYGLLSLEILLSLTAPQADPYQC